MPPLTGQHADYVERQLAAFAQDQRQNDINAQMRTIAKQLTTAEMHVNRPDAAELLDIKRGKWPLEAVKNLSSEPFEKARVARDASPLPDSPDRGAQSNS